MSRLSWKMIASVAVGAFYTVCLAIAKESDYEEDPVKLKEDPIAWVRQIAADILGVSVVMAIIMPFLPFIFASSQLKKLRKWKNSQAMSSTPPSDLYGPIG